MKRNSALDSFRGLAVLLMVLGHFSEVWLRIRIVEPTNIQFYLRPGFLIFIFLFGYFLEPKSLRPSRLGRLSLAALASNFIFVGAFKRFDILVSMLLVLGIYRFLGSHMVWGLAAIFLGPWDPTVAFLDYPLSFVLACVAYGVVLREENTKKTVLSALLLTSGALLFRGSLQYTLGWVIPTTLLMQFFLKRPWIQISPLELMGRHSLLIYSLQWYVLSLTRYWWVLEGK